MDNKKRIECLIANVDKMRENTQEMRMWKNIPLAKECVQLLRDLDDPEETPMGKALACEASSHSCQSMMYHVWCSASCVISWN